MIRRRFLLIILLAGLLGISLAGSRLTTQRLVAQQVGVKRASSAIALSTDGSLLLAVNPDSNSISIIDTAGSSLLAEVAVGVDPRTIALDDAGTRAYVANHGSDSVSVIDLETRRVVVEVPVGNRPYGVVVSPDGSRLYVAEQGSSTLRTVDTTTFKSVAFSRLPDRPSGLAITDDGQKLYITHLLSNFITVLDTREPFVTFLPLVLRPAPADSQTVTANGRAATIIHSPTCKVVHLPLTDPQPPCPMPHFAANTIRLSADSNLVQSIVIDPNGDIAYVAHTHSNSGNRALAFNTTVFPRISLINLETQQHLVTEEIILEMIDPPAVGLPFDVALTPDNRELWVVNAASNDVTVVNLAERRLAAHIEVEDNPRGIVLSPDRGIAYVNNTLAGTVSAIDTGAFTVTHTITTTQIPLPPLLLQGKRLFHSSDDPRVSRDHWVACNTCHFDGEQDGRTWTFGFAGPRNTTSLLGMIETYPLRWAAEWDESADSEFAIRRENFGAGLVNGEMHCDFPTGDCVTNQPPNQGLSDDLDALAAFLDSLAAPLSPNHARGEPLSPAEKRGRSHFNDPALGCVLCHPPPLYTDQKTHNVGTAPAGTEIEFDTPTLRGLYGSAPYFHDGSAVTLTGTLSRPSPGGEHDLTGLLSPAEIQDLVHFLLALPYE